MFDRFYDIKARNIEMHEQPQYFTPLNKLESSHFHV